MDDPLPPRALLELTGSVTAECDEAPMRTRGWHICLPCIPQSLPEDQQLGGLAFHMADPLAQPTN